LGGIVHFVQQKVVKRLRGWQTIRADCRAVTPKARPKWARWVTIKDL